MYVNNNMINNQGILKTLIPREFVKFKTSNIASLLNNAFIELRQYRHILTKR